MTNEEIFEGLTKAAEEIGVEIKGSWLRVGDSVCAIFYFDNVGNQVRWFYPSDSTWLDKESYHLYGPDATFTSFRAGLLCWMIKYKRQSIRKLKLTEEQKEKFKAIYLQLEFFGDHLEPCVKVEITSNLRGCSFLGRCLESDCLAAVRKYFLEPYPQEVLIDVLEEHVEGFSGIYHWGEE